MPPTWMLSCKSNVTEIKKNQNKTPSCEHGISLDFHLLKLKGFLKCNMHFAVATCANVQSTFYVINVAVVVYFGSSS